MGTTADPNSQIPNISCAQQITLGTQTTTKTITQPSNQFTVIKTGVNTSVTGSADSPGLTVTGNGLSFLLAKCGSIRGGKYSTTAPVGQSGSIGYPAILANNGCLYYYCYSPFTAVGGGGQGGAGGDGEVYNNYTEVSAPLATNGSSIGGAAGNISFPNINLIANRLYNHIPGNIDQPPSTATLNALILGGCSFSGSIFCTNIISCFNGEVAHVAKICLTSSGNSGTGNPAISPISTRVSGEVVNPTPGNRGAAGVSGNYGVAGTKGSIGNAATLGSVTNNPYSNPGANYNPGNPGNFAVTLARQSFNSYLSLGSTTAPPGCPVVRSYTLCFGSPPGSDCNNLTRRGDFTVTIPSVSSTVGTSNAGGAGKSGSWTAGTQENPANPGNPGGSVGPSVSGSKLFTG